MSALQKLRESGHQVELLDDGNVRINPPPPKAWIPRLEQVKPEIIEALQAEQAARLESMTEAYHERAAIAEYDGGLPREKAEEMAIRTVWEWQLENGDGGTDCQSAALTYDEARMDIEQRYRRKVTHLEFISAIAEGFGFVAYRPELGVIRQ